MTVFRLLMLGAKAFILGASRLFATSEFSASLLNYVLALALSAHHFQRAFGFGVRINVF